MIQITLNQQSSGWKLPRNVRIGDESDSVTGIDAKFAVRETLTAPKVDSVNTLEAPNAVVPKPISARAQGGKLILQLDPKSVTVVSVEQ